MGRWPLVLILPFLIPPSLAAQQDRAWNSARVLELVERARDRRQQPIIDETLRSYRADATGYVYFFIDQEGDVEPVLLRADQVALEVYWAQPDMVKQVIRGMRHEEQFPIRDFHYYVDRYTVIHGGFGDEIRVGEGRDVRDVPHPLAPRAETLYDYRLADSLTIRLPGEPDPIRVYEIQVRPRDFGGPAIVGSLFVERARADLVRLAFTFTPAAYIDPRNERVEITLENALWEGRYWLPREQRLLVRRELPQFDIQVGTVIRATLRVTNYELNADIPAGFFLDGRPVVAVGGREGLARYPFAEGLYAGLPDIGLAPTALPGTLEAVDVHAIAGRIVRERYLRGTPRVRFYVPDGSSLVRYNRVEGLVTGGGLSYGIGEYRLTGYGAYAWGASHPVAAIGVLPLPNAAQPVAVSAYYRRPISLGMRPASAGVLSSTSALLFGEDYGDLYHGSGVAVRLRTRPVPPGFLHLEARWERHVAPDPGRAAVTAPADEQAPFRPVLSVDEVTRVSAAADLRYPREAPWRGRAELRSLSRLGWGPDVFFRQRLDVATAWRGHQPGWGVDHRATLLFATGELVQDQWLLGGPNTLPGHPFHAYNATTVAATDLEAWRAVVPRWLRIRALAAGAWIHGGSTLVPATIPGTRSWQPTAGGDGLWLGSVGAGIGLVDGILRIDYAHPLGGDAGRGRVIISVDPRLWPFL